MVAADRGCCGLPPMDCARLPPGTNSREKYGSPSWSPSSWIWTIPGCWIWATARASMWNRAIWSSEACAAGQDHLERDQAIQPDVPGLVDDAHAASTDLRDDLVARHGQADHPPPPARARSPADCRAGRGGGFVRLCIVRGAREVVHCPGSFVRGGASAAPLRASGRGHVERFVHAGRRQLQGRIRARRRRVHRLADSRAALPRFTSSVSANGGASNPVVGAALAAAIVSAREPSGGMRVVSSARRSRASLIGRLCSSSFDSAPTATSEDY